MGCLIKKANKIEAKGFDFEVARRYLRPKVMDYLYVKQKKTRLIEKG